MSTFEVKVYKLVIEEHPNADALEVARVGDFMCLVRKDMYQTGDLAVYIPEAAIVPVDIIEELGLEGRLSGKQKNRVKAIKLRGVLSQGLIYPINGLRLQNVIDPESGRSAKILEGDDVAAALEIVKYEPPVPVNLSGKVHARMGYTIHFDIDNIKKYNHVFQDGDEVDVTEKLHGTWCCLAWHKGREEAIVTSKGLSSSGLVIQCDNPDNENNLYVQMWKKYGEIIKSLADGVGTSVYVLGEIFGPVQDLKYGEKDPVFAVFDIYMGNAGEGTYMTRDLFYAVASEHFNVVPSIYRGPFKKELLPEWTNGKTMWKEGLNQIREGVVIRDPNEGRDSKIGRRILKSVSEKYLLRKDGTEFN